MPFGFSLLSAASCASALSAATFLFVNSRKSSECKSMRFLGWALLCVCIADVLAILSYPMPGHEMLAAFKVSEVLYLAFICLLMVFVFLRFRLAALFSRGDKIFFICVMAAYGMGNYVYILKPFLLRLDSPDLFNIVVSTTYAIVCAVLVPFLIIEGFKNNNLVQGLLVHSLLLLNIIDFAIRYKTAFPTANISPVFEDLWHVCMLIISWLVLLCRRQLFESNTENVGFYSLRGMYAVSLLASFFLYGVFLNFIGAYRLNDISLIINILLIGFFIWTVTNVVSLYISRSITSANSRLLASWGGSISGEMGLVNVTASTRISEFKGLADSFNRLGEVTNKLMAERINRARIDALAELATQLAHDIRSPLAALDAVLRKAGDMPEQQRVMVRHAVNRIHDIANNLLEKNRQPAISRADMKGGVDGERLELRLLSSLIDPVITEKRIQFESKKGIQIEFELTRESYGLFATVQPVEFRRMLSNLLNNAVEALGDRGEVRVSLVQNSGSVVLKISDNGKGIPPGILVKLGQKGETYGKSSGSGLGLYHAKTSVERWGGRLNLESEPEKGTTVMVTLPSAPVPEDFVSVLKVISGGIVVVLDDDPTTHKLWEGRFESARLKEHDIEVHHFNKPDGLRQWIKYNSDKAGETVYLFDYELMGYKETGLSLAEELGLCGRAILVTSRSEEKRVMDEARRLKMRIIPKGLADFVPLSVTEAAGAAENGKKSAVLIDDDALVHMNWADAAEAAGVDLKAFKEPGPFLSSLDGFPKDVPIYIDSELGNGVKGEDIAAQLKEKGFTDLTLETGHGPERFAHLPWLKVRGKESPWKV